MVSDADITRLNEDITQAHRRIDSVVEEQTEMKVHLASIQTASEGTQADVGEIKTLLLKYVSGIPQANANTTALVFRTVQIFIVCSAILGAIWAGVTSFSASKGDTTVEASK